MKKIIYVMMLSLFVFIGCIQEDGILTQEVAKTTTNSNLFSKTDAKVSICHNGKMIEIAQSAIEAHIAHGDAVDMDGDGFYTGDNPCSDPDFDDAIPFDQSILVDIDGDGFFTTANPFSDVDCDDNAYSLENSCGIQIGDYYEGGIVFWINPNDNTKGLVCAVLDQGSSIQWYNGSYIVTGATGTAIGTGASNTDAIITNQTSVETDYAAGLARAYTGGGFTDWFLPSKDELNEMYQNKTVINATATVNGGGIFSLYYWSSTEFDYRSALFQRFNNFFQSRTGKHDKFNVRAVRAF